MATSGPEHNVELARGGLEDWIRGDREAAMATFTDDIELYVPPELGNAGTFKGLEEFRRWNEAWEEAWSEFELEVGDIEPAGDSHVIAMIRSKGTGAGSGIEVANELAWVLSIRGEKTDYISLHPDRAAALAMVSERDPGFEPA